MSHYENNEFFLKLISLENIGKISTLKKKNLVILDIGKRVGVVGVEQLKKLPETVFLRKNGRWSVPNAF
jgi:hypothetical protein